VVSLLAACHPISGTPATRQPGLTSTPRLTATRFATQPGGVSETPLPQQVTPTSNRPLKAADLQGVPVEFWVVAGDEARPLLVELVDQFDSTNQWGIQVTGVPLDSLESMEDRYRSAKQDGKLPGLLAGYTELVLSWDAGGASIVDLSRYVEDPDWGLAPEAVDDFYAGIWSRETLTLAAQRSAGSVQVGLPWYRSGTVLLYNQTWASQLGFAGLPFTPDEFSQQACAAAKANNQDTDRRNNGSGGWLLSPDASTLLSWIFAYGGQVIQPGGGGYRFDSPQALAALRFIHGLHVQGCAWLSPDSTPLQEFAARRALFVTSSMTELRAVPAALTAAGSQDTWTVLPFPSPDGPAAIDVYGPSLIMLKASPDRQLAAWLFARWLVSPEIMARWTAKLGVFPVRASVLPLLGQAKDLLPQQQAAQKLVSLARPEPAYASWSMVRWALQDALRQMLMPEFQAAQAVILLENLDRLAAEIHAQVH